VRAELHERLGRWLDTRPGVLDEIVGYHLEQAYALRAELGDERAPLALEAGGRLGESGIRAIKRFDLLPAVNLLGRAAALLPEHDRRRSELLCELGLALKTVGTAGEAESVLDAVVESAVGTADRRIALRARIEQMWPRLLRGAATVDESLALLETVVPIFEEHGDERGLARAWQLVAGLQGPFQGRRELSEDAATRALDYYRRTGFAARGCIMLLAAAAFYGPRSADAVSARVEELLADPTLDRGSRADLLMYHGSLRAMQGDFETARDDVRHAGLTYSELREKTVLETDWTHHAAAVELLACDPAAAESLLRDACAALAKGDDQAWLATHTAALAEALAAQGGHEEALQLSAAALEAAPLDDLTAQTMARRARGVTLSHSGLEGGERLVREALELLEASDELNARGEASLALAEVLSFEARHAEARAAADAALDLFETKGNLVLAGRARALSERLAIEHLF